jgi:hypothetical protein
VVGGDGKGRRSGKEKGRAGEVQAAFPLWETLVKPSAVACCQVPPLHSYADLNRGRESCSKDSSNDSSTASLALALDAAQGLSSFAQHVGHEGNSRFAILRQSVCAWSDLPPQQMCVLCNLAHRRQQSWRSSPSFQRVHASFTKTRSFCLWSWRAGLSFAIILAHDSWNFRVRI